jgi:hypothetical protein
MTTHSHECWQAQIHRKQASSHYFYILCRSINTQKRGLSFLMHSFIFFYHNYRNMKKISAFAVTRSNDGKFEKYACSVN